MDKKYEVIKSILETEKSAFLRPHNQYMFWVAKNANKIEIKKAVEDIYKVKVKKVNTSVVPGKNKRVRYVEGQTAEWKRAIVLLKAGDKIDTV